MLDQQKHKGGDNAHGKDFVLLTGDGRAFVALDYRDRTDGQEPAVVYWQPDGVVVAVAPDFGSFLQGLEKEITDANVAVSNAGEWVDRKTLNF